MDDVKIMSCTCLMTYAPKPGDEPNEDVPNPVDGAAPKVAGDPKPGCGDPNELEPN